MSILEEAAAVVNERQTQYGTREENFGRIAEMWTAILDCPVTPQQVALCMIALKVARLTFRHSHDSLVDICGYAHCLAELAEKEEPLG